MTSLDASVQGVSKGGGTRPFGQHDETSAESSAGRLAFTPLSSSRNGTNDEDAPVQPQVTTTNELAEQVRGGDRRIARRPARGTRVTVRLSEKESTQLARVANRYRLSESGAMRAAVDYLDGAPPPKAINVDVLRLVGEVNAVGVNVNQIARQGWSGVEPAVDELRRATATLLAIAKEMSA